jgi:Holliday junction DNA helicase RuvB
MSTDTLRPTSLDEFIGQKKLLARLNTHIAAAIEERRPLEHTLLAGPPGFGKTTLSTIIADLLHDPLEIVTMPVSEKTLQTLVASHEGVLVLDEIHAASKKEQEMLLPLLEFGHVQTKSGYKIEANFLTIIGATTEPEKVIPPLYDRFKIKPVFEEYSEEDMALIVIGMAAKADLDISAEDALILGRATGGTPRNASQLVLAGRALQVTTDEPVTAEQILTFCDIDTDGLDRQHYRYLETLAKFGGTRGLTQIATVLRLSPTVCMDLERLLFSKSFINYGAGGRELTSQGYQKVKTDTPRSSGGRRPT